ncbi:cysteine proteinase [Hesseltinella vesiculosa]|uniref:ubiquitinyl hydrolase 1 n=1 Tax=Hesseltinella vesiculosa TaxID=101127 RepID=A0A1X2GKU3_9FUNG|nr:cysteine proteinase [Hesseltinella vesiculosa]
MSSADDIRAAIVAPWSLIENRPENFIGMARMYGVKNIDFKEVFDHDSLPTWEERVYGLIFGSEINVEAHPSNPAEIMDKEAESLFFSNQIVTNVCATSALLAVLLNIDDTNVDLGEKLREFKEFTMDMDPVSRGLVIGNCDLLVNAHRTFGSFYSQIQAKGYPRHEDIYEDSGEEDDDDEVPEPYFHYSALIPANGFLWELDGYNRIPTKICAIDGNWLPFARDELSRRLKDSSDFVSILAVVSAPNENPPAAPTPSTSDNCTTSQLDATADHVLTKPSTPEPASRPGAADTLSPIEKCNALLDKLAITLDALDHEWNKGSGSYFSLNVHRETLPESLEEWISLPDSVDHMDEFIIKSERPARVYLLKELYQQTLKHRDHLHAQLIDEQSLSRRAGKTKASTREAVSQIPLNTTPQKSKDTDDPPPSTPGLPDELDFEIQRRQHDYTEFFDTAFTLMYDQKLLTPKKRPAKRRRTK